MHYVYILQSLKTEKLYKGSTTNLKRRLNEHNSGNVTYTQPHRPWKLIYYEAFCKKSDALREEVFLKSGKGRERIKRLFQNT